MLSSEAAPAPSIAAQQEDLATLYREWQIPMYDLDFSLVEVSREELEAARESEYWSMVATRAGSPAETSGRSRSSPDVFWRERDNLYVVQNSDHVDLPILSEQYAPLIAANAFRTASRSSTKPANRVGTNVP